MALGVSNGTLQPLSGKPNAVSTQTDLQDMKMRPLPFKGTLADSKFHLLRILQSLDRVKIVKDDVEFYFDEAAQVIHFRSASRVGYSDWGVNRKRMEDITRRYEEGLR